GNDRGGMIDGDSIRAPHHRPPADSWSIAKQFWIAGDFAEQTLRRVAHQDPRHFSGPRTFHRNGESALREQSSTTPGGKAIAANTNRDQGHFRLSGPANWNSMPTIDGFNLRIAGVLEAIGRSPEIACRSSEVVSMVKSPPRVRSPSSVRIRRPL